MGVKTGGVVSAPEIERKLDADPQLTFPDLSGPGSGLPPGARAELGELLDLHATYFDSSDLRLLRQAITLRHRTGGTDAGWHLKLLRADGERQELRLPPGRSARTVPAALRRKVAIRLRAAPLHPVAHLATRRQLHLIRDDAGRVLAEIADDTVTAVRPGHDDQVWREIEVELVDGDEELLSTAVSILVAAGARPSESRSKVGRALGEVPGPRPSPPPAPGRPGRTGTVLLEYVGDQIDRLLRLDPDVRDARHDAVHQLRVTCRRLRSVLTVYREVFAAEQVDPLRVELAWLGTVLGRARDTEVIRDLLLETVRDEPRRLIRGPVRRRITTEFRQRARADHAAVLTALDSTRYFALVDALETFRSAPELRPVASRRAVKVFPAILRAEHRRLRKAGRIAERTTDPGERDMARHQVRKTARRLRFAGEAATAALGDPAIRFAERMKAVQDVLGKHQDAVIAMAAIAEWEPRIHAAGESTFSYGRLHALLAAKAANVEERLADPWRRATSSAVLRWLG